jgi:hypothetical protein
MSTEPSSSSTSSFTFSKMGLGLRAGSTPLTIPKALSNPSRLQKALIRLPRTDETSSFFALLPPSYARFAKRLAQLAPDGLPAGYLCQPSRQTPR